jgi:hypothetical protein
MSYRRHDPPAPLLIGYDPFRDLPPDHLARLIEQVVEESVHPARKPSGPGQPAFDPRLCLKVLLYGYATGVRSSRRLEQLCGESLPFLFLTRGDAPCYRTLCTARKTLAAELEAVWSGLFAIAAAHGLRRLGSGVVDTTRWRANASREATVDASEFPDVLAELQRILAEAEVVDAAEERTGPRSEPRVGQEVAPDQIRDILRRLRKQLRQRARAAAKAAAEPTAEEPTAEEPAAGAPPAGEPPAGEPPASPTGEAPAAPARAERITPAMRRRLQELIRMLEQKGAEEQKRVNLTDPDAEFMLLGASKKLGLGHSFEAAADQGLLVAGHRGEGVADNHRLEPILAAARRHEPEGITRVDADSGFYQGEALGKLLRAGVDVCVPDANTAGDLHRGQPIGTTRDKRRGDWSFLTWDADRGRFTCRNDNERRPVEVRTQHGQTWTVYRAVAPCRECPFAASCLRHPTAQHRTLHIGEYHAELEAARERFREAEHQERYHQRGPAIETVFAFLEQVLGYRTWWLRGKEGVTAEARWLTLAYQVRKVHRRVVDTTRSAFRRVCAAWVQGREAGMARAT